MCLYVYLCAWICKGEAAKTKRVHFEKKHATRFPGDFCFDRAYILIKYMLLVFGATSILCI